MLTATNRRLLISESHDDSNQSTPCRGHLINMPHTFHVWSPYGPRPYVSHVVHIQQPFTSRQQGFSQHATPNSTSQPDWVAHGTHLSFCPNATTEAMRISQAPVDGRLLVLLGPYHQHMISTFNTCSWGPTHRSLTDTGAGYNLGGDSLSHYTPRPSQPTVLHFPPKGPARSQVIQNQHKPLVR
jgi:hypothetical protein